MEYRIPSTDIKFLLKVKMNQEISPEQIVENYNKFRSYCEKLGDRSEKVLALVDSLGEQLALCPASGKLDYHRAIPGGLVEHSLRVLSNAVKLTKEFGWSNSYSKESLIISSLFHDIGKVGLPSPEGWTPYYISQESEWHREKSGEMYKHNDKMPYMTTQQRSVFVMQYHGINLAYDEYLAILLNDGWVVPENKPYCLKEPPLAHVIMTADYISTTQEKQ